ncbi:peptidyl-prolyl cis-trans isomerase, cyclophilin-type [Toxoplasma gondii TgCatPRC2]|uniref:Peptidyl-prolyl cis-trans isomerase, cyclophilin-type n=1 Tax=Toxoplasma gondii TgCatPRC2 TaxID=1130821 RepID=A0A151HAP6_TOXGO|nr:peptidyl-prolyl cis-trans isomerase, cyclophilin-type [Toxoplasma gondii TgCatPRC2]
MLKLGSNQRPLEQENANQNCCNSGDRQLSGVLGMCPCATGGTGTQFYVCLKPLAAFDKKFVAIGRSVMGMNALLLLLQRQLVPCDANTQRPAGDALFIKKIDVFID